MFPSSAGKPREVAIALVRGPGARRHPEADRFSVLLKLFPAATLKHFIKDVIIFIIINLLIMGVRCEKTVLYSYNVCFNTLRI